MEQVFNTYPLQRLPPPPAFAPQNLKPTPFIYESLDTSKREIRLLQLCSAESRKGLVQKVVGHLLTVSLEDAPCFDCLSYQWELPAGESRYLGKIGPHTISINGCTLDVEDNLYAALIRLMNPHTTRLLWADAICIDQTNKVELGDQVAKMGAIYAAAARVIVWLGEAIEPSWQACLGLSLLDELWWNLPTDKAVRKVLRSKEKRQALNSLSEILQRDYWSRVWVIQEVHFARSITVHCGKTSMPWNKMVDVQNVLVDKFLDILDEVSQPFSLSEGTLKHIRNLRHAVQFRGPKSLILDREDRLREPNQIDLFEGLMMHRLKKSTDPRDKIYAIVGLTKAADDPDFVIDYRFPTDQVFINTVDYLLRKSESLEIILVHTKGPTQLILPTWIPDFSSPSSAKAVPFRHAFLQPDMYRAAATRKAEARIDLEKGTLFANGICIASVGSIAPSPQATYSDELDHGMETVQGWKRYVLTHSDQAPVRLEEFKRLLLCDIPEFMDLNTKSWVDLFDQDWLLDSDYWRSVPRVQTITHNIFKRHLFITENVNLGMAQDSILKGDLVCVLFGCSIPVILRRVDGHFIYISDACLVGYMYGKGIEELKAGKREKEVFEIH